MKLYELSSSFAQLMDMVENEEISIEDIKDTLESIDDEIGVKFENISKMIKNLDGQVKVFKEEETRLSTRRKSMENKRDWLKGYLLDSLELTGKKKVEAGLFTVAKQKNPVGVQIVDKSQLPEQYLIPQEPKEDKTAILEALKNGFKVEGATFKEDSYHVRIR